MIPSAMDVTLHCDDDVCIEINISNLTKAEEIIHQVISLRRSMSPSLDLDFQECILCLEIGTSRRILSRESILLSLLIAPGKKSLQQAYRITASGFRMKTAVLLRSINDQRYLIERKTLELRYLTASAGSRLPSDLAPPLQITNYETDTVHDTNTSSSSKSCSDSRLHGSNLSRYILQKYEEFVNEVREILAHRRTSTEGSLAGTKTLQLNKAEDLLVARNVNELLLLAADYESTETPSAAITVSSQNTSQKGDSDTLTDLLGMEMGCSDGSSSSDSDSESEHAHHQIVSGQKSDSSSDSDIDIDESEDDSSDEEEDEATEMLIPENSASVTKESERREAIEDLIIWPMNSTEEVRGVGTNNDQVVKAIQSSCNEEESDSSDSDSDSEGDSSNDEEKGVVAVRLTTPTSMPIHQPDESIETVDTTSNAEEAVSVVINTVAKLMDNGESSSGYDSDSEDSEDEDTEEEVQKKGEIISAAVETTTIAATTATAKISVASDAATAIITATSGALQADIKGVSVDDFSPPQDDYSEDKYSAQDADNGNVDGPIDNANGSSSGSDSGDSDEDISEVPAMTAPVPAPATISVKSTQPTSGTGKLKSEEKDKKDVVAPKTMGADEESPSSSSGEEEDSDEDSSSEEEEEVKKPPLALLQLLYKKPTAKFPSCFLPPKPRRLSSNAKATATATDAAFTAAAATQKKAAKDSYMNNNSILTVTGLEEDIAAIVPSLPPIGPIKEVTVTVFNANKEKDEEEENKAEIETDSEEEMIPKRLLTSAPVIPVEPSLSSSAVTVAVTVSTGVTSAVPPLVSNEVALSADFKATTVGQKKEMEITKSTQSVSQGPLAHQKLALHPVENAPSKSAGSSSSECSSESTLTDESDSDDSNVEVKLVNDKEVGKKDLRLPDSVEVHSLLQSESITPLKKNIGEVVQSIGNKNDCPENDEIDVKGTLKKQKIDSISVTKEIQENQISLQKSVQGYSSPFINQLLPSPSVQRKTPVNKFISPSHPDNTVKKGPRTARKIAKEKRILAGSVPMQRYSLGSLIPLPLPLQHSSQVDVPQVQGSSTVLVGKVKGPAPPKTKKTIANSSPAKSAKLPSSPRPVGAARPKKPEQKAAATVVVALGTSLLPIAPTLTQTLAAAKANAVSKKRSVEEMSQVDGLSQKDVIDNRPPPPKEKAPRKKA